MVRFEQLNYGLDETRRKDDPRLRQSHPLACHSTVCPCWNTSFLAGLALSTPLRLVLGGHHHLLVEAGPGSALAAR